MPTSFTHSSIIESEDVEALQSSSKFTTQAFSDAKNGKGEKSLKTGRM